MILTFETANGPVRAEREASDKWVIFHLGFEIGTYHGLPSSEVCRALADTYQRGMRRNK